MIPLPELPPPPDAQFEAWEALARLHKTSVVWAEGNARARIAIVLDNPGAREREGVAWVCPTRETLRAAAREAGLGDLYITWLVKFRPRRAYDKPAVRALGRKEVLRELARVDPRVVVGLGDVVAPTLLDDPGAHVRELRGRERSLDGRPFVVSYHPLAAKRRPNLYPLLVEDLRRAGEALERASSAGALEQPGRRGGDPGLSTRGHAACTGAAHGIPGASDAPAPPSRGAARTGSVADARLAPARRAP